MKSVNIGLLGLGTVGGGTAAVLQDNAAEISRRLGRDIRISAVCDAKAERAAQLCPDAAFVQDPFELVVREDVDVVVELFGGTGITKDVILKAISSGKHIVTANKKLLAEYGNEVFALAAENNVMVQFEAAVAGGIPIIKALREGLAANRIRSIAGIINGTSNFILTEMREKGSAFADVLKEAQALGYAEADPTFDIEGHDAGHKITIMSALAFGMPVDFSACYLEGISKLDSRDIKYAEELGYRIKLLGITRKTDKGIELRVHPTLIPECRLLANVNGVMNAVRVNADMVGETLYYGAGAGALPTASAVVADIIDIARLLDAPSGYRVPYLAFQPDQVQPQTLLPMDEITSSYYLRVCAADKPGTLGQIANLLAKENVSIEALIQKGVIDQSTAEIVILTHSTVEKNIKNAIAAIEALDCVDTPITMIRMESLHD
ncbi:homoserine dehydrogenase [Neisseria sp. ZJ106]|uniref:Homoserine dehydrogenase n=1 Tax=Neisseria lisongii TaxID=2912188 RepID=A0AAW5ALA5_9NEIS|nr:homoserine dehydrogenase [Neisseria lisongii]MCF7521454.1 homoserine dehydrogenase [Neisseria lisongii]MCF7529206.1 homoserine dehydrogenase [Neisseria lisongii]WCL72295.1 homoserine dehydrogenase [Neisseria lisongii]